MPFDAFARNVSIVSAALVLVCSCTRQTGSQSHSAASAVSPTDATAQHAILRAYVDPVTGQLRDPTPEELAAEAAEQAAKKNALDAKSPSTQQKPREVVLPDGTIEITLDKSAQHPLRACILPDGTTKLDHECDNYSSGDKPAGDKK